VVFNSTQTSRSFKFLGWQKAIKGVPVWLVAACPRGVGLGLTLFVKSVEDRVVHDY